MRFVSGLIAVFLALSPESATAQTPVWTQFAGTPAGTTRNDDVVFADQRHGWSAREIDGVYRTVNGGQTWTRIVTNLNGVALWRCIGFASTNRGWVGNLGPGSFSGSVTDTNVLYETFDGGDTWSVVPGLNESGMKGFCAMQVLDAQHVYGAGRVRGPAYFTKTENGGASWFVTNLSAAGVMGGLMDVYFKDSTNGFVVGMDTNAYRNPCVSPFYHGAIARTTNGGLNWTVVASTPVNCSYFWKMSWPSANTGYASLQQNGAHDTIIYFKTIDGGATWTSNGIPFTEVSVASFFFQGIGFVNENEGWLGGSTSGTFFNTFLQTTNGGSSWTRVGYENTQRINRMRFASPTLGYASGSKLHVYKVPLAVASPPQSRTNAAGTAASFNVTGHGTAPLGYQWRFNGTNIPAATTNLFSIASVHATNAGTYDVIISDFGGTVTSAPALLAVEGVAVPPSITAHPQSLVSNPGSNATFTVSASGTAPLSFQWRFNGTNISNATQTTYTRTNAQIADVGSYAVVVTNVAGSVTSAVALLAFGFSDDFDSFGSPITVTSPVTTNGYKILFRAASGAYDFKAIFGFNYSTVTYPTNIPSAPSSVGGTTKGLYLTVNKDATAAAAAVNLYPAGQSFSGNFALRFDLWINWRDINTSTEHALFGINHSGTVTNRVGQSFSDGLFFAVEGEDDSSATNTTLRDFSVFRGNGAAAPVLMITNNTTFGPAPLLGPQFDNTNPGFVALFPTQTIPGFGTTPAGVAGLRWLTGEVRQENNLITWRLNGTVIAQYTNTYAYTNGTILIGYNDHFSSIGDTNNFAIFDNIRVEPLIAAAVLNGVPILSPRILGNNFSFDFVTDPGGNYAVQRATDLSAQNWQTYTNVAGNGSTNSVSSPVVNLIPQYFRVLRQ